MAFLGFSRFRQNAGQNGYFVLICISTKCQVEKRMLVGSKVGPKRRSRILKNCLKYIIVTDMKKSDFLKNGKKCKNGSNRAF